MKWILVVLLFNGDPLPLTTYPTLQACEAARHDAYVYDDVELETLECLPVTED